MKHFILYITFTLISISSVCQPNFVIDTILLPGKYIQKVSAARSSDVWIIEDTSSRNIYRIDSNLSIYNHSLPFQTITNSSFTSILNNDTNFTFVGTSNDYVYSWNNNFISKINSINGLTDSTINGIVGFPKTSLIQFNPKVLISGNGSQYFSTSDYLSVNSGALVPSITNLKVLEREKVRSYWGGNNNINIYTYSLLTYKYNSYAKLEYSDQNSVWVWGSQFYNWQKINTATIFWDFLPRPLIGMDNQLVMLTGNSSVQTYLTGIKVNKIIKYRYDSHYALVGTDSGLYVINVHYASGVWPPTIYKSTFPENNFKVQDVDITPNGCVWLATDTGLVRLRDTNCNEYKTDFSIVDTVLMLDEGCEIKFNECMCSKTWQWDFGDGGNSATSNPSHLYSQSGNYNVSLITSNGSCLDTVAKTVSIIICCDSSKYNFVNLGNDTAICINNSINLNAGNCVNCNYQWSTGASTATINVNSSGNYWVKLISPYGCPSYDSIDIIVNQPPSVSFSGLLNNYCQNDSIANLVASPAGGVFSGNGISGNSFNPGSIGIGIDTITYTYIDADGCTNSTSQTTSIVPLLTNSITSTIVICSGETVNLTASGEGFFLWNTGDTARLINVTPNITTTYSVISSGFCVNSFDTISIHVNSLPIITISNDTSIFLESGMNLLSTGGAVYSWSPTSGLSCSNCPNPIATPSQTTTYTVTVADTNGCIATDDVTITIDCGEIFIPNFFSPNSDNQNDLECIYGHCIESITFSIFNRWGEKVFETTDKGQCWDGTYNGKLLDEGVFVYYLKAKLITGEEISKQGNISLIR